MTESHHMSQADAETGLLMPQTSPRTRARHDLTRLESGASRYGSYRSEREYATLADQLEALHDDIHRAEEISREAQQALGGRAKFDVHPRASVQRGETITLACGSRILIRPIEPDDEELIKTGFKQLSAVSRYRRFLTPIDYLSKSQLVYLANVDHQHHEAFVALDSSGEGVGIARCVRDPKDAKQAEVAVVVADEWQGRGAGRALIERLASWAREAGVERFTARMLIGNHAGHRLFERVADDIEETEEAGTIELTARLRALR
jgi:GNAT superfamily N-acetyltransferase